MRLEVTNVNFINDTLPPILLDDQIVMIEKLVGQYEIKGSSMADRENQLWELLAYNSLYEISSLEYRRVPVT
tara:strand:- start:1322 stop:1537 length:216 start_codon:yes stop_codon:yes gene_type:complete